MVDIRELQKKGALRIPANDTEVITDKDGFVELGKNTPQTPPSTAQSSETSPPSPESDGNFFSFMDSSSTPSASNTEGSSDELRKVSTQLSELDNKLYKLEQRLELLERKAGIGDL